MVVVLCDVCMCGGRGGVLSVGGRERGRGEEVVRTKMHDFLSLKLSVM